ncbi:hypothetical protein ACFVYJ_03425 [Pontibacter sp. JAM-7]|uniref:hypothetical protein n=1 Tax=Pontibacter sp. JAM-7 TaxID=3366581 RepID=UPI003AF5BC95
MDSNDDYLYDPRGEGVIENFCYFITITVSSWFASMFIVYKLLSGIPVALLLPLPLFAIYYSICWKNKRYLMPRIPLGYKSGMLSVGKFFIYISSSIYFLSFAWLLYIVLFGTAGSISGVPFGIGLFTAFFPSLVGITLIESVRRKAKRAFSEESA